MQGLLELAGVPYVGSGVLGSALCMDKLKAKDVLAAPRHPPGAVARAARHRAGRRRARASRDAGLRLPGVREAGQPRLVGRRQQGRPTPTRWPTPWRWRASYDEWIVVEEGVDGREIEVAVLGNAEPRGVGARRDRARATSSTTTTTSTSTAPPSCCIPADLPDEVVAEIQRLAVEAFTALRCDGMARVDFFYEADGRGLLLNEVNTIPGFTPISMYPKLWDATGLPYDELIDELVRLALERHDRRSRFSTKR